MIRFKKIISMIIIAYALAIMFMYPKEIKASVIEAVGLWSSVLLPSLYPYLVISQYIISSGTLEILYPIKCIVSRIYNLSLSGSEIYLCSLFSGYPSGALCTSAMRDKNIITSEEAKRLVCFTNNPSPVFIITAVGSYMMNDVKKGVAIYVIQTLSSAIWGFISRNNFSYKKPSHIHHDKDLSFSQCCVNSVKTMLEIGGYIIISGVGVKLILILLRNIKIGSELHNNIITYSIFEISGAMKCIAPLSCFHLYFGLMCACASWGGISVIMQIYSVTSDETIFRKLVVSKASQAIMSFFFGFIYSAITDFIFK